MALSIPVRHSSNRATTGWCWLAMLALCFALPFERAVNAASHSRGDRFIVERGDVIAFCGGEDVVAMQRNGYLETLLTLNWADQAVRFRNLGWEGDTVYEQPRQLNFGSWSNQFQRAGATVIVMQFGQSESLQGQTALPGFIPACNKLLDEFSTHTPRIVLLSPTPFEGNAVTPLDWRARNEALKQYVDALRPIAQQRRLTFIDLFIPLKDTISATQPLTRDGLHLNDHGHWLAAQEIVRQLGLRVPSNARFAGSGEALAPMRVEQVRQAIVQKNQFWFNYWRPMNWAFLHGDRTDQPSSRDHRNPKIRWFPEELEKFQTLIQGKEEEIMTLAKGLR
jgi:GDSL-like lipase/acylhydrolase family protein